MTLLFAYGTLRDPAQMAAVIGHPLAPPRPAVLAGYRRLNTRLGYPALLPAPGQRTPGLLWTGLTDADMQRLDTYEECHLAVPAYFRQELPVDSHRGLIWAWVYVANPAYFENALLDQ